MTGIVVQIGVYLLGQAIVVAVLKNDIKWLGKTLEDHRKDDLQSFARLDQDIRDLRKEL